jgi:hypothetical protein
MSENVRVEFDDEKRTPDLAKFRASAEDPEEERKRKQREKKRRYRERKRSEPETPETIAIDPAICHVANVYLLAVAGTITGRRIEPGPEHFAMLDSALVKVAEKYAEWLQNVGPEVMYLGLLAATVLGSPKVTREVSGAIGTEPDRPDPRSQGEREVDPREADRTTP